MNFSFLKRYASVALIFVVTGATSISCSEDIPECPSKACLLSGEWQLIEVYVDGAKDSEDLSKYRLNLVMPAPISATASDYSRTQPSGTTDNGDWSIENNGTILRLVPNGNITLQEDWIIEKITPREMILVINRDTGIKDGPSKIEFRLEPI